MSFTLNVSIATEDFLALKEAKYKLCISKKVNDTYNTVWKGDTFLPHNTFQWTSRYQVFGTLASVNGDEVSASTETPEIQYGQTAVLDQYGSMHQPQGSPNSSGTFTVTNQYGAMNIGVNGFLGNTFSPIFVSTNPLVNGNIRLTPVEAVLVWFDATHHTSTIVTDSISNTIEVDFTGGISTRSVTYKSPPGHPGAGVWSLDNQLVLGATFHPATGRFEVDRPSPQQLLTMAALFNARDAAADGAGGAIKARLAFTEGDTRRGAVAEYAEYLRNARPDGVAEWDVYPDGKDAVVARIALREDRRDLREAAREIPYKYLSALRGWHGAQYKRLSFETPEWDV